MDGPLAAEDPTRLPTDAAADDRLQAADRGDLPSGEPLPSTSEDLREPDTAQQDAPAPEAGAAVDQQEAPTPDTPPAPDGSFTTSVRNADFASTAGWVLNGSAHQSTNVLRLTDDTRLMAGSAYWGQPFALSTTSRIQIAFSFRIAYMGGTGGDGMTLVLQNDARGARALGGGGSDLGYGGSGLGAVAIQPSLAIEFDTLAGFSTDPDGNHVAVLRNGDPTNHLAIATNLGVQLDGGQVLYSWLDYDGSTATLDVFLAATNTKPARPIITYSVNLAATVGAQAFVGFGAGTGTNHSSHDVLSISIDSTP